MKLSNEKELRVVVCMALSQKLLDQGAIKAACERCDAALACSPSSFAIGHILCMKCAQEVSAEMDEAGRETEWRIHEVHRREVAERNDISLGEVEDRANELEGVLNESNPENLEEFEAATREAKRRGEGKNG